MSKYLLEMMLCYEERGTLLSKGSTHEMMKPQLENAGEPYGLFWHISSSGKSIGHTGGDPGTVTSMYFQPSKGIGKVMFINMAPYNDKTIEHVNKIWTAIRKYEAHL